MDIDITNQVRYEDNDGEVLPLTRCVCGEVFPAWDFIISIYRETPHECHKCKRKFYFRNSIHVYEVKE